jgi:4-amino-4-deoxy-L-arabinose transferase-like glycosyltransferase
MNEKSFPIGAAERDLRRGNVLTDGLWVLGFLVMAIALLTLQLGNVPLRDWDEGLVAQVAREIWRSPSPWSAWLYPTVFGEPYLNKPPLVHGLIAIAYHLGGVNEWTARLPGALLTTCSVPLMFWVGREVFYPRLPAVFATLVYLTSLPVIRNGRLAMLDGAILCFFLLTMGCVLRSRRDCRFALGVGIGLGLICLTKGIMIGVLLGAIALLFLIWDTPRLLTLPYFWLGILTGCIPVGLWYGAQWMHYGESFLDNNLVDQSFQRIWTDVENNGAPPWYYFWEIIKSGAPWILFLPLSCQLAWQNLNLGWAKLGLVWSGVYLVAISLMATKLPWYSLPFYPAIALLIGAQLADFWKNGRKIGVRQFPVPPYSLIWVGWFVLLAIASWVGYLYFGWWSDWTQHDLQPIFGVLGITMPLVAILIARQNRQFLPILIWGTYLSLLFLVISPHWNWELNHAYPVKPVAALIQQQVPQQQTLLTSDPHNRPSLNFYSDRKVLPASNEVLKRQWRRSRQPYFLLDDNALEQLKLRSQKVLGTVEGWSLVTKQIEQKQPKSPNETNRETIQ